MTAPGGWRDRCTLLQADYRETLAAAAARGGADLIATSPPYCDARTYGASVSWTMDDYRALGDAVWGALKPGGHALINVDAPVRDWAKDGRGTERGLHPWRLMIDWHDRIGFRVPDRLAYGRQGLPGAYAGRFRNDWEPLLWFQRPGGNGAFDRRALAEAAIGNRRPHRQGNFGGVRDGSSREMSGWAVDEGKRHRGTLWEYGLAGCGHTGALDIEDQGHPARWPYKLAEDLVRCFAAPGALVVDPFLGAGTTAAAALAHGRTFLGGDSGSRQDSDFNRARGLEPLPWVEVAARVLDARYRQIRMFGP